MSTIIPQQAPNGLAEIVAHYGDPKITRDQDGTWAVDPRWESANMTTIHHPLIPAAQGSRLYMHSLVAPAFLRVLERWSARIVAGESYRVLHLGCFAPRAQRGSSGLLASTHSWGIAVDLNPDANKLITNIDPEDTRRQTAKDIPDAWIMDAKQEGWFWGGEFHSRFDPMHFQFATGY